MLTVVVLNLGALLALVFIYPELMVSPGHLIRGHEGLETDCFACHSSWRGARAALCIECHAVADIGLRTTRGVPIATPTIKSSFHQELVEQDCVACHSDHEGPRLTRQSRKPFSHELLRPAARERCATCHRAPADRLHRKIQGNCKACHRSNAWKPATFDHARFFVLDSDHDADCDTCHMDSDYSRYTCYGCHEHTEQNIRAEHLEEGITDFGHCVECHRSATEEPRRTGRRRQSPVGEDE